MTEDATSGQQLVRTGGDLVENRQIRIDHGPTRPRTPLI
jgi:hypothetical protein